MPTTSAVQYLHNVLGQIHCQVQWMCRQTGPPHAPMWEVTLMVNGTQHAVGHAGRKHAAKEAAAEMMLGKLNKPYTPRAAALWGAFATDPLVP